MPLILFFLSTLVLTLEVLETKIFAYSLANNLIFLVVGIVLLGFGAGGTVLSLREKVDDPRPLVKKCLLWTSVLLVIAHGWFAVLSHRLSFHVEYRHVENLREAVDAYLPLITSLSILILLAAPYFCAGMAISAILADPNGKVHRRYAINLLGSALGCVTVFFILGPLTGPECLAACAIACALLAVPLAQHRIPLLLVILVLGAPTFVYANRIFPYQIQSAASGGQLALIERNAQQVVASDPEVQAARMEKQHDRWDPTARVQVHAIEAETTNPKFRADLDRLPCKWFTQDSSYGSPLIGVGRNPEGTRDVFDRTCYGIGYFRKPVLPKVLVIGLGGAPDIQSALHHEPETVDGVDINRSTYEMVKSERMAKFLGSPYLDPRVRIHIRDGRSFVRSTKKTFDLIQLSGVDTKSILASGTLALNESYLYTRQGMAEYIEHLNEDGILCILYAGEPLRDRFAVTAMDVLRNDFQSEAPHKHLMMVGQSKIFCFLVKRTPFTPDECKQMDAWIENCDSGGKTFANGKPILDGKTDVSLLVYELLNPGLSLNNAPEALFIPDGRPTGVEVMEKARAGAEALQAYIAERPDDISPAPDSRPFFFNTLRNEKVLGELWEGSQETAHFREMVTLLLIMVGLSVLLILGPLLVFSVRGVAGTWRNLPFSFYFAALGAGFVMAMSGLIQRYVLFLGHQGYAFPVVVGGLLVAAGLGSVMAGIFQKRPQLVMVVSAIWICAALAGIQLYLDDVFAQTAELELAQRIGVALLVLFPLGVPLGMMFPTGLAVVRQTSPMFVPWAFGINGVFSVIGSTIVLPGSILYGFPNMSIAAGATYVLAALIGFPFARKIAGSASAA